MEGERLGSRVNIQGGKGFEKKGIGKEIEEIDDTMRFPLLPSLLHFIPLNTFYICGSNFMVAEEAMEKGNTVEEVCKKEVKAMSSKLLVGGPLSSFKWCD
ncbi:hypothetical protein PIB30_014126 [Stylosanthes scabra]|uniref:Uncharacterized protein n=1 Tax=Stylosanthes scabra TaxID=79078 RepID=A0ABU6T7W5_9FABA|nr:hypothetical protein [Stylosanthes scabra]